MLLKQSIEKKSISFFWILIAIILLLMAIEGVDIVLIGFSPLVRSLGSLVMFIACVYFCYQLIYFRLAEFHYRIVADDLVFERVVGRSNHAFITMKPDEVINVEAYHKQKIAKRDIFTNSLNKKHWLVLTFKKEGRVRQIIIEPQKDIRVYLESLVPKHVS
ncbi:MULTISPECIES: hypothetical protein [unclassified Fusibacter]|uniref:hypothetical protein n=1 Tax=unclassified Fusibacter TaxID=2624464 RepID=UPI0010128AED|nr:MULTISPECIES: hypothetical protein [unclassified Fusibacter]MCK8059214.1 hypothetical protein [Fusibacter sp. A2]NPE21323.1 hypothetical protein [Fusibacter sp. A1]RXV62586.1 hypothetical protein DWB64_05750 [Fusibacter sp. A1]